MFDASASGMIASPATYQIDSNWLIVHANYEFCRLFRCSEPELIGRDIRTLLREDWRLDLRAYVARALVGVGDHHATVPMVAPCGEAGWFKHSLEPMIEARRLVGYRATITPHQARAAAPAKRWWDWRPVSAKMVWNFESQQAESLAKAS